MDMTFRRARFSGIMLRGVSVDVNVSRSLPSATIVGEVRGDLRGECVDVGVGVFCGGSCWKRQFKSFGCRSVQQMGSTKREVPW